jgi:hypothetical protein
VMGSGRCQAVHSILQMPLLDFRHAQGAAQVRQVLRFDRRHGRELFGVPSIPQDVELALPGPFSETELDRKLPLLAPDPFPIMFDSFDDADSSVRHIQ